MSDSEFTKPSAPELQPGVDVVVDAGVNNSVDNGDGADLVADAERVRPEIIGDWSLYRRLLGYVVPYLGHFALSILGFMLFAFTEVMLADLMQFIIDSLGDGKHMVSGMVSGAMGRFLDLQPGNTAAAAILIPITMITIALLRGVGSFMGSYFIAHVGRSSVHDLRCALFEQLVSLPSLYFDRQSGGFLVSRITYNVDQVTGAITKALTILIREGATVIFLLSYIFYYNAALAMVFLIVAPPIALIVSYVSRRFRRLSRRIQNSMGDVTHVTSEAVNGHRVMHIFGGERYERERFHRASEYNCKQSLKMAATSSASTPIIQLLVAVAMSTIIFLGLQPAMLAEMTPGGFVSFLTAAGMLAKPIRQLSDVLSIVQKGLAAAQDIFAQLDEQPEPDEGTYRTERVNGSVRFDKVSLQYGPQLPKVLNDISFEAPAGKTIALVGSSGSGKSSLVSLLPRFYTLSSGSITLDDVPIDQYTLASLRQQIALVNQQVVLFNDTVFNNIAYGSLQDCDPQQVEAAARMAHAMEFIDKLPDGMQTLVGDNGVLLSGGQRQRIAIARAILKDAPILILDEATSALDNESEYFIQDALERVMEGRTTFVIAHRLSTVEEADMILVLEAGSIVERGSHAELLAMGGRYARLYHNAFADQAG